MRRIWSEQFVPMVFDLDVRGEVTPGALCRFFGVAAGHHATELNLGDEVLRAQGIAWMLNRLEMRLFAPSKGECPLSVETWPSVRSGRLRAEREFVITGQDGVVAAGLSTWLLIQLASRRPARMPASVLEIAVSDKAAPFEQSPAEEEAGEATTPHWRLPVLWTDLDINGHATFTRLVEWTLGTAPQSQWASHRLESVILKFEQEALAGEELIGSFDLSGTRGTHSLIKTDGAVAVRGWSKWRVSGQSA